MYAIILLRRDITLKIVANHSEDIFGKDGPTPRESGFGHIGGLWMDHEFENLPGVGARLYPRTMPL